MSNVIKWVIRNKKNQLFVGTDKGLNYLHLDSVKTNNKWDFAFFNKKEGYSAYESNYTAEDSDGNIIINTHNGFLKINTNQLLSKNSSKEVVINQLDLFYRKNDSLLNIDNPKLNYDENVLSFYFNKLNFINSDKDIYYYRLKPYSDKWQVNSGENKVNFYNLPNGEYTFQVKCKNINTGIYSNTASYSFVILKPWWNSILFY